MSKHLTFEVDDKLHDAFMAVASDLGGPARALESLLKGLVSGGAEQAKPVASGPTYRELSDAAKAKGLNPVGKTKAALIEALSQT